MASYWQKYGLTSDPFVDDGLEYEPFFPPRWQQQLDLLRHLARSSNMALLVTGISGVGKTTFMEMLLDKIESKSGVCKIHGSNGVTPDVLQELIIRHIGMPATGSQEANFQQRFLQQIERMFQKKDEFYLVIDNAHKLPKSSLALLVDIAEWQTSEMHPLHLILFGGPQLDAMMAEITAQHLGEAMTHTIRIEPFSLEMTRDYILNRLTQAGFSGSYPLSELQTNQIHQASNGIPAKINIIARQVLLDNEPKNNKRKNVKSEHQDKAIFKQQRSSSTSISMWVVTGIVTVIGVILFVVYYFRAPADTQETQQLYLQNNVTSAPITDTMPSTVTEVQNNIAMQADMDEEQTQTEGLNGMVTSKPVVLPRISSQQSNEPTNTVVSQEQANVTNSSTDTQVTTQNQNTIATSQPIHSSQDANGMWVPLNAAQAKTINQSTPSVSASLSEKDDKPSTPHPINAETNTAPIPSQPVVATKISTKTLSKTTPTKKAVMNTPPGLTNDEQVLMASNPARYTLQIAAAADYQGLKAFIKAVGLDGQVYFFKTLNAGHLWYVAVYGDFSNDIAAREAISKLPASLLAKEHPWPRSFGNVQKAMRSNHETTNTK